MRMQMSGRLLWGALLLSPALWSCGDDPEDTSTPMETTYTWRDAPMRCYSSVHAYELHDVGDRIAISYQPRRQNVVNVSMAFLTLLTEDEGRSFTRPVATMVKPNEPVYRGPLEATNQSTHGIFELGRGLYMSTVGVAGTSRLPGPEQEYSDRDWLVFFDEDGEGEDVFANGERVNLPSGERAARVWRYGDVTVAEAGMWLWASIDGGPWEVAGWRPQTRDVYPNLRSTETVSARTDLAIIKDFGNGDFYSVRPGEPPQVIANVGTSAIQGWRVVDGGLWGDSLVVVAGGPAGQSERPGRLQLWAIPLGDGEVRQWPWPTGVSTNVGFREGEDGTLWIHTRVPAESGDEPAVMRLSEDSELLERLRLDFEAAPFDGVPAVLPRDDGGLLFVARTREEREHRGTEYFGSTMFCRVGPDVEQGVEPMAFGTLDEVVAEPGVMHRVARVSAGSSVADRFVRTPAGTVFATSDGAAYAGPPDYDALPLLEVPPADPALADLVGYSVRTFLDYNDTGFVTTAWAPSSLLEPPPTQRVRVNLVDPALSQRSSMGFGKDQIFTYQEVFDAQLAATASGTFFLSELTRARISDRVQWPGNLVVGRRQGYAFDRGYSYARAVRAQDGPTWVARFTSYEGRVPDVEECTYAEEPPEYCIALEDADIVAARVNDLGDLYALDYRHGRVLLLETQSRQAQVIATGFVSPADIRLTQHQGQDVVLVYDGDIWAFSPDTATLATRQHRSGAQSSGSGDLARASSCEAGEPCVDLKAFGGVLRGEGRLCIPGVEFGESGTLRFERDVIDADWSATEVCFDAAQLEGRNGQLTLTRADGLRPPAVPYYGPSLIFGIDVPAPLTSTSPITFRGTNLMGGYGLLVSGGSMVSASDDAIEVLAPHSGVVSVFRDGEALANQPVEVIPTVAKSCVSGPGQPCEMVLTGMPTATGEVRVGGEVAEMLRWDPPYMRFAWPESLEPGEHPLALQVDGGVMEASVTLLPAAIDVLSANAPLPTTYDRSLTPPIVSELGLISPVRIFQGPSPVTAIASITSRGAQSHQVANLSNTASLGVVSDGTQTLGIGNMPGGVTITRLGPPTDQFYALSWEPLGLLSSSDGSHLGGFSGAGFVDGELVVVLRTNLNTTRAVVVDLETMTTRLLGELPGAYGTRSGGAVITAHGSWVNKAGVFAGNCYANEGSAQLYHLRLSREAGELVSEGPFVLKNDTTSLVACDVIEGGFAWVERAGSVERIYAWDSAAGEQLAGPVLPPELPGMGPSAEGDLPSVLDVAKTDDDWLVMLADREGEDRGAYLARWDATTEAWSIGEPFGISAQTQEGSLCVGPLPPGQCDEGIGRYGCSPAACPVSPTGQVPNAEVVVYYGDMLVVDDAVHVFYQVVDEGRDLSRAGGIEAQYQKVPMP